LGLARAILPPSRAWRRERMKNCPTCRETYPSQYTVCPRDGASLRTSAELEVGAMVRGKYQVLAKLGQGGMGVVYKVRHIHLGDVWALKLVSSRMADEPGFMQRFRTEALLMRRLDHPNVVRVYDFDETEDGRPFIVMECVEGQSLDRLVAPSRPLDTRRALQITMQACGALAAAHRLGIIHRDIKPANLLVARAPDGSDLVKVVDFGVAKVKESGEQVAEALTRTGFVIGTPDYMSPEQAQGVRGDNLDGRTDLYSLGVVLFHVLTGQLPFVADTPMKLLLAHIQSNPPDPRTLRADLSPATAAAVLKALQKDRARRFADAAEMSSVLAAALESEESALAATARHASGGRPTASQPVREASPARPPAAWPPSPPTPVPQPETLPSARAATPVPAPPSALAGVRPVRVRSAWTYVAAYTLVTLGVVVLGAVLWTMNRPTLPISAQPAAQNPAVAPPTTAEHPAVAPPPAAKDTEVTGLPPAPVLPDRPAASADSRGGGTGEVAVSPGQAPMTLMRPSSSTAGRTASAPPVTPSPGTSDVPMFLDMAGKYEQGNGVIQNSTEAVRWYRRAADRGDATGQVGVGLAYLNGRGAPQDDAEAARWFRKAAEQGNARGQNAYGMLLQSGRGVPRNDEEALKWIRASAAQGEARGQYTLALAYQRGTGVPRDDVEAARLYRKAAEQNHVLAEFGLAWMLEYGQGVAKNEREAAIWYRKAADQGNAKAQVNLGRLYARGAGVQQDDAEAVRWYRNAAEQNDPVAQANLGGMLESGRGVAKSESEAAMWYRRAADQGNAIAQNAYGIAVGLGRGVAKDEVEAARWFLKAAEQSFPTALFNLGVSYGAGRGVTRDAIEAYKWYTLALNAGYEKAAASRQNIAKGMQPAEVVDAERRAAEWQARHPKTARTPGSD
jgi:TPR repeat protein/serine/threonine protein kinase